MSKMKIIDNIIDNIKNIISETGHRSPTICEQVSLRRWEADIPNVNLLAEHILKNEVKY